MKIHGGTIEEALNNLIMLRRYKPFQYSGKFFVVEIDSQFHALRSMQAVNNKVIKAGGGEKQVYIVE